MPKMQFAGVSVTVPDSYVDRSVYAIAATDSQGPFQRNLTITFDTRPGLNVGLMAQQLEKDLVHMRLSKLRMGAKGTVRVSGRDAVSLEYASDDKGPTGPIRLVRRVVFVPLDGRVLVATFTANESEFAIHARELDAMLASLQV